MEVLLLTPRKSETNCLNRSTAPDPPKNVQRAYTAKQTRGRAGYVPAAGARSLDRLELVP